MITCHVTPGVRAMRVLAAVVLAAFSGSMWSSNLLCAVPAAICATFLLIGAITGWCPTQLLQGRSGRGGRAERAASDAGDLGFPTAPTPITIGSHKESRHD
ncbi:hypothetical protein [Serinibacter salmoneus]|uniref:DUF2892 family protein n=1 Tax=Serinibacter salmoneus TaxID=556530 RepID=A0A2A9CX35_9MICO|nr:hypothetical protein [Serinibacter salmoneus]PFG18701.1 hypothetical protein ATL40_0244 [Serinibacter salmoneus]